MSVSSLITCRIALRIGSNVGKRLSHSRRSTNGSYGIIVNIVKLLLLVPNPVALECLLLACRMASDRLGLGLQNPFPLPQAREEPQDSGAGLPYLQIYLQVEAPGTTFPPCSDSFTPYQFPS